MFGRHNEVYCEMVAEGKASTWHYKGMISRMARFHYAAWDLVNKDPMVGSLLTRDNFFV